MSNGAHPSSTLVRVRRRVEEVLLSTVGLWVIAGFAAAALLVLRTASALLAAVEAPSQRSFGASVFSGFTPSFWNTDDLRAALLLWEDSDRASSFVYWHIGIDIVFVLAATVLAWRLLRAVDAAGRLLVLPLVYLAFDWLETVTFAVVFSSGTTAAVPLAFVQLLSLLKWLAVAAIVSAAAVEWWSSNVDGPMSRQKTVTALQEHRRGHQTSPALALHGQIVIVGLFVLLIAYPAGGPLEQIPDVLRYQLSGAAWTPKVLSVVALGLFVAAVAASAVIGEPAPGGDEPPVLGTRRGLLGGAAVSLVLILAAVVLDGQRLDKALVPGVAPLLVMTAIAAAAWLAPTPPDVGRAPGEQHDDEAVRAAWRCSVDRRRQWIASLSGVVVMAGGLGLVRACAHLLMVESFGRWLLAFLLGLVVACVGGFATQAVVRHVLALPSAPALAVGCSVAALLAAAVLAIWPGAAIHVGTTGAVVISLAAYSAVIGGLQRLSRRALLWEPTRTLRLGARTPWAGILLVTWLLASVLNTSAGYHTAVTLDAPTESNATRWESIDQAFGAWRTANLAAPAACRTNDTIPLVLVAAPGGGIRAAYWTATALQELFGRCPQRVFGLSGASGGSVGATVWATTSKAGASDATLDAVTAMSRDESLASTAAALLLRDLPQPLLGLDDVWRDRAEVLEDGWTASTETPEGDETEPFGSRGEPRAFRDLWPSGGGWEPLLILNSSSVTDGCRALVTNLSGMTTSPANRDCLDTREPTGPSRATLDPLAPVDGCRPPELSAVTAALLSARFPFVTPSGALERCVAPAGDPDSPSTATTYLVDGGYYENSGVLAVLELWSRLEPLVERHNAAAGDATPRIEPWIVVTDNHYRSFAAVPPSARPQELLVPLRTVGASKLDSQAALEQAAALTMFPYGEPGCPNFVHLGPRVQPALSAPLGWVLSVASRRRLQADLQEALTPTDAGSTDAACTGRLVERFRPDLSPPAAG